MWRTTGNIFYIFCISISPLHFGQCGIVFTDEFTKSRNREVTMNYNNSTSSTRFYLILANQLF
jgi:hypothetical protein